MAKCVPDMIRTLTECRYKFGCKETLERSHHTGDSVSPCLSGSVSGGWRDRRAGYDDLHLVTTGGE